MCLKRGEMLFWKGAQEILAVTMDRLKFISLNMEGVIWLSWDELEPLTKDLIQPYHANIKVSVVTLDGIWWHSTHSTHSSHLRRWQVHLPNRVPAFPSKEAHLQHLTIEEFVWNLWCWTGTTIPQNMRFSALYLSRELVCLLADRGVSHR